MPLAEGQTPIEIASTTVALLMYILGTAIIARHLFLNQDALPTQLAKRWTLFAGAVAALAHTVSAISYLFSIEGGFNLSLFPLLSFIGALMVIATTIISALRPFENITVIVYPIAALLLLLPLGFESSHPPRSTVSTEIILHIVLSLMAYATLGIAFAQALLVLGQNYQLKHKRLAGVIQVLPPLQLMESILFGLIWLGVILLTLAIATGMLFVENIFDQKLAHKTFFTLCAWGTFTTLLIGQYRSGWRGLTAVRWTIAGFAVLLIGFVGTKVVLEIVLTQ